jgi:hypothetical protein
MWTPWPLGAELQPDNFRMLDEAISIEQHACLVRLEGPSIYYLPGITCQVPRNMAPVKALEGMS